MPITEIFNDQPLIAKIQRRLPHLFHYAERDSSRAGKVGMEVGSIRERILVSLLIYKFGRSNVQTELPITEHDVDVLVNGERLSIKSVTTKSLLIGGVKAIWTVDADRSKAFSSNFSPTSDYLVAHIVWGGQGGLYYIPRSSQANVFDEMGVDNYLKLPKLGTNPRGVEISTEAMRRLVMQAETKRIEIRWQRPEDEYDAYARWIEYWRLD
ncbi:MAG: ThaI family type II restriction endonuclease [Anaerolineales bacterium]|nr:ThaI family type II restriction endonuclease [Anaerolineales bacterium]